MLPFLKSKDKSAGIAGTIIKTRTPDTNTEDKQDDGSAGIQACAEALIAAVHANDVQGVSDALKDAFEILESQPHDEAEEKPEPHSYEASQEG